METGLELVKLLTTFSISFLIALGIGRLCMAAFFQGLFTAKPAARATQRKIIRTPENNPLA